MKCQGCKTRLDVTRTIVASETLIVRERRCPACGQRYESEETLLRLVVNRFVAVPLDSVQTKPQRRSDA